MVLEISSSTFTATNTAFEEFIDAGIHVCNSAGNDFRTINGPVILIMTMCLNILSNQPVKLSVLVVVRPAPYIQNRMFLVGNIDDTLDVTTQKDRKSGSSNSGPVNIFAGQILLVHLIVVGHIMQIVTIINNE